MIKSVKELYENFGNPNPSNKLAVAGGVAGGAVLAGTQTGRDLTRSVINQTKENVGRIGNYTARNVGWSGQNSDGKQVFTQYDSNGNQLDPKTKQVLNPNPDQPPQISPANNGMFGGNGTKITQTAKGEQLTGYLTPPPPGTPIPAINKSDNGDLSSSIQEPVKGVAKAVNVVAA